MEDCKSRSRPTTARTVDKIALMEKLSAATE
jgi:hypothetical protein